MSRKRTISMSLLWNNRGVALLITLGIISVLIVVAVELNRKARLSLISAGRSRDRATLTCMGASAVNAGIALLIKDKMNDPPSGLDSIQEDWANPEAVGELLGALEFEDGEVTLSITDELGKIQVNTLVKFPKGLEANDPQMFLWDRFLKLAESSENAPDDIEPKTIVDSAKDWLDSGDDDAITGLNGAESDYYQNLDPPYECKNGPIDDLDELVLIRGIIPELYYGLAGEYGLSTFMTTTFGPVSEGRDDYFKGKININTADLPVLAALLPSGAEILASAIYEYREAFSDSQYLHDLSRPTWYKNAPGCGDIEIDSGLITVFSDFFQLKATAVFGESRAIVTAVVERVKDDESGKWTCKLLSWHID
jgi:general secretion pathway protein K